VLWEVQIKLVFIIYNILLSDLFNVGQISACKEIKGKPPACLHIFHIEILTVETAGWGECEFTNIFASRSLGNLPQLLH
jgi:hypothetical protein